MGGKHLAQTIERRRNETRALNQTPVRAKCPCCERIHKVLVGRRPNKLLRIFCVSCRNSLGLGEGV